MLSHSTKSSQLFKPKQKPSLTSLVKYRQLTSPLQKSRHSWGSDDSHSFTKTELVHWPAAKQSGSSTQYIKGYFLCFIYCMYCNVPVLKINLPANVGPMRSRKAKKVLTIISTFFVMLLSDKVNHNFLTFTQQFM